MLGVNTPALPASLRRTNQRTILSLLLRMGRATRADLAKAAGISQPTAGKITAELLQLGVLQQVDDVDEMRRLGRPGQLLQLDRAHRRFLAVELGLRQTRVSALPVAFTEPDVWQHEFVTPQGPDAWASSLQEVARTMGRQRFWGALVSVPGIVDEERRKILFSPNLHWLEKVNFTDYVQRAWEIPVEFVQEIRALALGQLVAAGGEDFFLVDFGQGVGGAMVLNGQLFTPPMPLSGEFGHSPVPDGTRRCGCGAVGCLETMVSEYGLLETFREHAGGRPRWADLLRSLRQAPPPGWLMHGMDAAARVIAGALNVLGVHKVVVTGYLSDMPPAVFERLSKGISDGAMWARFGEVRCELAPRRRAAGLVAAGLDRLVLPENEEGGRLLSAPLTEWRGK